MQQVKHLKGDREEHSG